MSESDKPGKNDSPNPMVMFMAEFKHKDVHRRLNSVKKLSETALALGTERTRSELLPFIAMRFHDSEVVMMSLAEELGHFTSLVGGPTFAMHLLPPLEYLATAQETVVRGQAIESLRSVVAEHSVQDLEFHVVPMLLRLATGDWSTSRSLACSLFAICYSRTTKPLIRAELRTEFRKLCQDPLPMVRRAAASQLAEFAKVVEVEYLRTDIVQNFVLLAHDNQDSVCLLIVEAAVSIARLLSQNELEVLIFPTVRQFTCGVSWRVRYTMAQHMADMEKAMGPAMTRKHLVPAFQSLLKDSEVEVRAAATSTLQSFCAQLHKDDQEQIILESFLPYIRDLVLDENPHIKSTLATVIMCLSPILGAYHTREQLLPLILTLVKDECPSVRMNILANLDCTTDVIGIQQMSESMLPALIVLARDTTWRVRLSVIRYMPALARERGQVFFDQNLRDISMGWLNDCVYAIREAGVWNMKKIVDIFGAPWAVQSIVPKILTMAGNGSYFYRMTCLFCVKALAEVCGMDIITNLMLPTVLQLADDPVANVRFNVAKTLQKIAPILDACVIVDKVKPTLDKLKGDKDSDVKYFAAEAILAIGGV
ncbi:serine/threonine-protein phosphatase PP2A 65 kDa regulatory subunit-like [Drosophila serrata]|uniref:serine/threonine-protein phosphatase PP2A 65 kDa regulatory subunit-like n=1 Tax=Drosophila serrata TaxID=7274 RepID=UPI000A1D107B|nr:serine/threonine-protein phosphatase PP2A 65 kDa regulatory subunit-like [Drosophila serrata]